MIRLSETARRALERSSLDWTDQDGFEIRAAVTHGIAARRRRARLAAGMGAAAVVLLGAGLTVRLMQGRAELAKHTGVALPAAPPPVELAVAPPASGPGEDWVLPERVLSAEPDLPGADWAEANLAEERVRVRLRAGATRLRRERAADARAAVALEAGPARFEVDKRDLAGGERAFRVAAGQVLVEVLGTVFTVDRSQPGRVLVAVEEGTVRVAWGEGAGSRLLHAGDRGEFADDGAGELSAPASEPGSEPPTAGTARLPAAPSGAWRELARAGHYGAAYLALQRDRRALRDDPNDLMLAADVARLSRHPEDAVAPLQRLMAKYPRDDRAAPAAFLLGRLLLESLGRAPEAATAFARAHALSPGGPLAEDALAREVQALLRAGDVARARVRAGDYLARFPAGVRAHEMRPVAEGR